MNVINYLIIIQMSALVTQVFCILVYVLMLLRTGCSAQSPNMLISKVKTDKKYTSSEIPEDSIYTIEVERISTTHEEEAVKCSSLPKKVKVSSQFEKFRVGTGEQTRQESIYDSLTTLQDRENGIESFEILRDKFIMVIMNSGSAYFLNNTKELQLNPTPISLDIDLFSFSKRFKYIPLIAQIDGNALVATPNEMAMCEPKAAKCQKIKDFKQVSALLKLYAFKSTPTNSTTEKFFAFLLTGNSLVTYEIDSTLKAINMKEYTHQFFGKEKIFLEEVMVIPGNKLLILDFYTGLIEVSHVDGEVGNLIGLTHQNSKSISPEAEASKATAHAPKNVYEQYGCRHMTHQNDGEYIGLQCSLTRQSYFILQLVRSPIGYYIAQQPIFFNEVLTGIGSNKQIVMAHIFSGVRLFWSSPDAENPYPYDYQNAGTIFLHNAKDSKISVLNGRKVIYISTEDELRIYQLTTEYPSVLCYSPVPIEQEYKVTYTYLCDKQTLEHSKICTSESKFTYQTWEHKQIGMTTTIIPLAISLFLVIFVSVGLLKLYKRYDGEIEAARLKYNAEGENQFGIE